MNINIEIVRSPAKTTWLLMFNSVLLTTRDTLEDAKKEKDRLLKNLGFL